VTESRTFGKEIEGVGIPSFLVQPEKRDLTVGAATQIGNTVATEVGTMIPYLQPRLQTMALGATMMTGLTSNVSIPRNNGIGSAAWEGETDENAETNLTTDVISLSPNRLGAVMEYSKQLLLQSTVSVDNLVRQDLQRAIAIALDSAAINGSGNRKPTNWNFEHGKYWGRGNGYKRSCSDSCEVGGFSDGFSDCQCGHGQPRIFDDTRYSWKITTNAFGCRKRTFCLGKPE
jgi:hypothetical protein